MTTNIVSPWEMFLLGTAAQAKLNVVHVRSRAVSLSFPVPNGNYSDFHCSSRQSGDVCYLGV